MEMPGQVPAFEYVEVRFKASRKEFFSNSDKLSLNPGDAVIIECRPGYDVGIVAATGELARLQMQKKNALKNTRDLKKILRKANADELQIWREARALEDETMYKARGIAASLRLEMKISDVEYQGDKSKAIFYYTAEGRIDFRELIRKLADTFRVRIEMKQIGARQEAGRLGGIGSCGRELCCSTWLTDFRSVSTSAARYQQLALNTQKLAGQCGKLKCCLNYELDSYLDALKAFPKMGSKIKTAKGPAIHIKTDIFKGIMWFAYEDAGMGSPAPISVERVKEILAMNEKGQKPDDLKSYVEYVEPVVESYASVDGQDNLNRFDEKKSNRKRKKRRPGNKNPNQNTTQKASDAPTNRGPKRQKPAGSTPPANSDKPKSNRPPRSGRNNRRKPRNKE
jgi:cell fate regulator YaaT (PSP1 superfamily)